MLANQHTHEKFLRSSLKAYFRYQPSQKAVILERSGLTELRLQDQKDADNKQVEELDFAGSGSSGDTLLQERQQSFSKSELIKTMTKAALQPHF